MMEGISCTDRVKQSVSISVGIFHKSCRCVRQFPDGIAGLRAVVVHPGPE